MVGEWPAVRSPPAGVVVEASSHRVMAVAKLELELRGDDVAFLHLQTSISLFSKIFLLLKPSGASVGLSWRRWW